MNYTELKRMPDRQALVYRIRNTVSGSAYVGSTVQPHRRWVSHTKLLRNGNHTSFVLQRAWDRYGEKHFVYEPLLVCAEKDRFDYEMRCFVLGGYNVFRGAGQPPAGSMTGRRHSPTGVINLKAGASRRWERERNARYLPLCVAAHKLTMEGTPRYKACKQVGISHSTFWRWLAENGLSKVRK